MMLRPSSALRLTAPVVVLATAVTPVCEVLRLMAAATCAPRPTAVVVALRAPMSTPLMVTAPAANAVVKLVVTDTPATVVEPTVAVTLELPLMALMAVAKAMPLDKA